MAQVTLFDIPAKDHRSWSHNPGKTRLALNYKNIPYSTQWVEYPDLAPTLSAHGIPPGPSPYPYTSPAVHFAADDTYLMDSKPIARELDRRFPAAPPLHPDAPLVARVEAAVARFQEPLRPVWMPRVWRDVLGEASRPYFGRLRGAAVGAPLDEYLEAVDVEACWGAARKGLEEVAAMLKEEAAGPFLAGAQLGYADVVLVSVLQFYRRVSEKELFERVLAVDESYGELYRACEQWLAKDT